MALSVSEACFHRTYRIKADMSRPVGHERQYRRESLRSARLIETPYGDAECHCLVCRTDDQDLADGYHLLSTNESQACKLSTHGRTRLTFEERDLVGEDLDNLHRREQLAEEL